MIKYAFAVIWAVFSISCVSEQTLLQDINADPSNTELRKRYVRYCYDQMWYDKVVLACKQYKDNLPADFCAEISVDAMLQKKDFTTAGDIANAAENGLKSALQSRIDRSRGWLNKSLYEMESYYSNAEAKSIRMKEFSFNRDFMYIPEHWIVVEEPRIVNTSYQSYNFQRIVTNRYFASVYMSRFDVDTMSLNYASLGNPKAMKDEAKNIYTKLVEDKDISVGPLHFITFSGDGDVIVNLKGAPLNRSTADDDVIGLWFLVHSKDSENAIHIINVNIIPVTALRMQHTSHRIAGMRLIISYLGNEEPNAGLWTECELFLNANIKNGRY